MNSAEVSGPAQATLIAHVTDCEKCQIALTQIAAQQEWQGNERRNEPRLPANGPAKIKVLNPISSTTPSSGAWIVDTSKSGMAIRVTKFMPPGAVVQVRRGEWFGLGSVRYCRAVGNEFHIGIQLVEVFS